jgi:AAA domain-containing protein
MRTIAITINKGGVEKTTLAKHLAVAAAAGGHNAMLLDMDAQQNSTSWASAGISSRRTRCRLFDSSPRTTCRRNWAVPAGAEVQLSTSAAVHSIAEACARRGELLEREFPTLCDASADRGGPRDARN